MKNSTSKHYGSEGRLGSTPKEVLIQTAYRHDCNAAGTLMPGLHKADLAHAIMLVERSIIPTAEGTKLIRGLFELSQDENLKVDPKYGDVYNSKDHALVEKIGQTAGWLHIGRARREAVNIAYLIDIRERILDFVQVLTDMADTLIESAEAHKSTVMLDYTYLHHAQPTTFGHYIMTFLFPLIRDIERFVPVFQKINRSPAGSGSVNGTNLPIDRELMKDLLCFEALSYHTRDAMWQVDIPIECLNDIICVLVNLNRLSDELQIWSTAEFNSVELPGSLCRASVIMPQKKNPYPLAYFRGVTNSVMGKYTSFSSYGKIASGNPDSRIFIYEDLPEAFLKSTGAIELLSAVLKDLKVNREVLAQRVKNSFAFATDLAELICKEVEINYRTAHEIVGATIRGLVESRGSSEEISSARLDAVAEKMIGQPLGIADGVLKKAIDPESILAGRQTTGGAGRAEIEKMIEDVTESVTEFRSWIGDERSKLSFRMLNDKIENYLR